MKKQLIAYLILGVFTSLSVFGQVSINTPLPNLNTLLHVSERKNSDLDNVEKKGIMIPRLTEEERDELTLNLSATDNSLMIFNTTENCYNFWNSTESEWKSLCGNAGNAQFNFTCSDIEVNGQYVDDKELNGSNYILIKNINVTKKGSYDISIESAVSNGYGFRASGEFLTTGIQSIRLIGQGTPVDPQVDTFTLISSSNSQTEQCNSINIDVKASIANYIIECATAVVNGTYLANTALDTSHSITIKATASSLGSYHIYTESKKGIVFSASGEFTSLGPHFITLRGLGTVTSGTPFTINVISNSFDSTECAMTIPVIYKALTYGVIGTTSTYGWGSNERKAMLEDTYNFGPNGKVRIQSFTRAWIADSHNKAITEINQLTKPDIILYFSYNVAPTHDLILALNNYVNAGGVLIFGTKDNEFGQANELIAGIFGSQYANAKRQQGGADDQPYPILHLPDDPIVNGPFGNTNGLYWGEDNGSDGTIVMPSLPPSSIQLVPASNHYKHFDISPDESTVWYNTTKNFVYFGDSVGSADSRSTSSFPAYYRNNVRGMVKKYGPSNEQETVANSVLEMNAIAWAIHKAITSGINSY